MKAYTNIEQSKKLAEMLPIESADMRFEYILPRKSDKILHNPTIGNPIEALEMYNKGYTIFGSKPLSLDEYCIPCWSLAALLSALPYFIGDYGKCLYCDVGGYYCGYMVDGKFMLSIEETNADNPIDACYEMVLKLHEQKLL